MTKKAGVIGYPISHSLSPRIHTYWLDKYDIDGTYEAIEVKPENLEKFLKEDLINQGYSGVNITLPHKEAAMEFMDRMDDVEIVIGAINTVYVTPDKKLDGNNTDFYGFFKNLEQGAPGFDFKKGKAVIIGAGGASRAVTSAIIGVCQAPEIVIINRTKERAEDLRKTLVEKFEMSPDTFKVEDWDDRNEIIVNANMLVNTTSLGMKGQEELDIDLSLLPKDALVTDIVYNPLETGFLKQARERGNITVDGLGMLLHQAVLGFYKWFGVEPEVTDELREHVLEGIK